MELQFLGGARTVTGSCFYLNTGHHKILVECGAFQGSREMEKLNYAEFPFDASEIDYVFLTHAHYDHVGRLPLLVSRGFRGKVFCTAPTKELARIIFFDSARLQKEDKSRSGRRENQGGWEGSEYEKDEPLFTEEDVEEALKLFETYPYSESVTLSENLEFRLRDAGHILGSAMIELWARNEAGRMRKFVFSGDIGQLGQRIIRDPEYIREADYICMEATYGNRLHKNKDETMIEFLAILKEAKQNNSNVIIPTFAIERTQELIYELNLFYEKKILEGLPVYLDSPMAIEATKVFRQFQDFYDEDAKRLIEKGDDPFHFEGFRAIQNVEESRRLITKKGVIIMAGSGMCTGGRVVHHLANNIEDPNNHIIFVGYQVRGTLGRRIVEKEPIVRIKGKEYEARAKIHTLGGFSAHGDERDLRYWLRNFGKTPRKVFICHSDEDVGIAFSEKIQVELGLDTKVPNYEEVVNLD
jgi:metallo-beta-lactamase family protein